MSALRAAVAGDLADVGTALVMLKNLFTDDGGLKPGVVYGLIALGVLIGGYFTYRALAGGGGQEYAMMCATPGCGYARVESPQDGETVPTKCPKCGKDSVYPSFKCPKCGAPNVWNRYRGLPDPTKCSKCGLEVRHG